MNKGEKPRHVVNVAGAELVYTVEGTGPPLLVVGSSLFYPRTFSPALRRSCALVCADLPHFVPLSPGFSTASVNFDVYAECIEAVRVAAGLGRVVVVGHSHHGNVALEYAKRYPRHVSHVVLIGSPPVDIARTVQGADEYWVLHASEARKEALADRRSSLAADNQSNALAPEEAYVLHYVTDAPIYWHDPHYDAAWLWQGMVFGMAAIDAFRNLYRDYELSWDAKALAAPVLVIMGKSDFAVPPTLWEPILPGLENVTFRVLDNSGHTPQLEQPEEFDQLLLNWLTTSPAAS